MEHRLQEPGCDTVSWGQMLNLGPFLYKSIKWTLTLDLTQASARFHVRYELMKDFSLAFDQGLSTPDSY